MGGHKFGARANGSYDGQGLFLGTQVAYDLPLGGATLTPKAGLLYAAFFQGGFTETGSPGNDLAVTGQTYSSLRPFVGATLAQSFQTPEGTVLKPEVRLAYSREVLGDGRTSSVSVNGTSFVIAGVSPSRNVLSVGAGITAGLSNTLALFADYNADIGLNNDTTHTVFAGFRMRF